MALITLAFVDAPGTSPTTVESLTTSPAWATIENFSLGAPTFEAPPQAIGGDYGYRTVSFTIKLVAAYSASAAKMQSIARQLLAEKNWLMLQWQSTPKPFFLRTYRTAQSPLDWSLSRGDVWELPVTLICEPFLFGAPQTVGPVTINNDPLAGTNPMSYKFGSILGDAPTELKVSITPSIPWDDYYPLMGTVAYDPAVTDPASPSYLSYWSANDFGTLGTNATVSGTNAIYINSDAILYTPVDGTMQRIVAGSTATPYAPGTYKILARVAQGTVGTSFSARLGQLYNVSSYTFPVDTVSMTQGSTTAAFITWLDMGQFTIPFGAGNLDAVDMGTAVSAGLDFQMQRTAGSGNLRIDGLLAIPVDTVSTLDASILRTYFLDTGISTTISGVWDGIHKPPQFRNYAVSTGRLSTIPAPRMDGRFPRVTPGATNVFYLVQQTKNSPKVPAAFNTDIKTATAAVTFNYLPKYLYLRPDTT